MSNTTDRINEENRKKRFEEVKEQGKQVESKLNLINEYNETLGEVGKAHKEHNETQKKRILRLAILVDRVNDTPKQKICAQVCKDLDQYGIEADYVRKILPDEYKDKKHAKKPEELDQRYQYTTTTSHGSNSVTNRAQNNTNSELQQKQKVKISNNGESILDNDNNNPLDYIHKDKSFDQIKRENEITKQELDEKIRENREEILQNPQNRVPLISDIPPELREKLEDYDSMKRTLEEKDKIATQREKDVFLLRRQLAQLKNGSMLDEFRRIKIENNNLKTELAEVDKEVLVKEGYKEVEVFKLEQGTFRMLQEISSKSQRTFFLLVHPKTMKIKGAKTDVQMHSIQAKRAAGVL